ncbi:hypothetical protein F5B19DRAFT_480701 [Rostrohypoxylon terebratum]|nr:hypothetical protein F5B19DRAFT_480701 [Rostrohypoxylon terebratum]
MRLACINRDGDVVEFETALQEQPYTIRGLLADALNQCYRIIPDSFEFLRAEGEVRNALRTFQGDEDKYARGYVLSRTLDNRTQRTPRADLILLALHHGGPLALIGIFYATLDAHRNRNRHDTLDYLLNRATDKSKLQLIMRSSTFPCNPSVSNWLIRIFEKLKRDSKNLACLLRCFGTSNVPQVLFRRLWTPSLSWGANGEPLESKARIATSLTDDQRFTTAIRDLEYVGFIRISATTIDLDLRIAEFLRLEFENPQWIAESVRILAHSFPKYRHLEPASYVEQCELLQPSLASVFSYLATVSIESLAVDEQSLAQFVEVCLSASYFRDKSWKYNAISIATRVSSIMQLSSSEDAVITFTVHLRRSFISLLYQETTQQISPLTLPVANQRSHALVADLAILNARQCVSLHTIALALEHLAAFDPSWEGCVSTLGAMQAREVVLMHARILRFTGRFQEAYALLETLPLGNRTLPLMGANLCEMGKCDEAIRMLSMHVMEKRGMVRARIVLAYAYLLKSMRDYVQGCPLDWRSLQTARGMLQDLLRSFIPASYFGQMDHLSILLGIAMVHHLEGQIDLALEAWQGALTNSQKYLAPGYTDMIVYYSISELEVKRRDVTRSDFLETQARSMFSRTGRQYHFIGLGSLWPEVIRKLLMECGRQAVIAF